MLRLLVMSFEVHFALGVLKWQFGISHIAALRAVGHEQGL
jgi:hypothetical protein